MRPLTPCHIKCATRRHMADISHASACPVLSCKMEYPLTLFFWVAKKSPTKEALVQVTGSELME